MPCCCQATSRRRRGSSCAASPGWTGNLVTSSLLRLVPGPLAASLALLPLLGWAGWRSAAGLTGFLLHLGYGVLFMLAGRANNFYWAMLMTPTWFVGLAFVPMALGIAVEIGSGCLMTGRGPDRKTA